MNLNYGLSYLAIIIFLLSLHCDVVYSAPETCYKCGLNEYCNDISNSSTLNTEICTFYTDPICLTYTVLIGATKNTYRGCSEKDRSNQDVCSYLNATIGQSVLLMECQICSDTNCNTDVVSK